MKKKISVISAVILCICMICAVCIIALSAENAPTTDIVAHNLSLNDNVYIIYFVDFKNVPENAEKGVLIWTSVQDEYVYGSEDTKITTIRNISSGYPTYAFTGVSAKMMSQNIYAKSYIKVGDDITYGPLDKYSVLQYCYNKKGSTTMVQGGTRALGELVEEMLNYGAYAQEYFGYNLDRLANATYYKVDVVNGTLPDGTTSGLYKSGEQVTLTADSADTNCWKTSSDAKVGEEQTILVAVSKNETYTASYTEEEEPILVWNGTTASSFDGGSGTENDPYLIATPEQFAYFAQRNNTEKPTGEYYKLTADLYFNIGDASQWGTSFNGNDATSIVVGPMYNLTDHGSNANPFAGTFDGDGYTISGFYGKRASGNTMGIFGSTAKGGTATIKNLVITNSYFEAQGAVGALVGQTSGGTTNISNVFVTDSVYIVSSANYAGGIVGHNGGNGYGDPTLNISGCVNGATVNASGCDDVAGILGNGNAKTATVSNCLNYGRIIGNNNVSGIVGLGNSKNITISYSVNIGAVSGTSPCQITYSTSSASTKKPTIEKCFAIKSTFGNANTIVKNCVTVTKAEFMSEGFLSDKGAVLTAWTELADSNVKEICVPTALLNAVKGTIQTSIAYTPAEETDFVPVIRFAMTSDVHISKTTDVEAARFIELFESAYDYAESSADYSALDAVIVAGDFTNNGAESELNAFKSTAESGVRDGTELITILGNHELKNSNVTSLYTSKFNTTLDKHIVINGIHFIGISPNYSDESIAYLEQELAVAAADGGSDTPIIVFTHHHIKDTVYVSDEWAMNATKSARFTEIFNQYPQVIFFSGHSHGPVNIPTIVWQDGFTAFGTGTLTYFEMTSGMSYGTVPPNSHDAAQYYIVEIDAENRVRVMPYNLLTDSFFKTPSNTDDPEEQLIYYIDSEKDPSLFRYADRAASADTPYFAPNAALTITNITYDGALLTIPQAFDGECIYSYEIECTSTGGKKFTYACFSEFYFEPMPETVSFTLAELEAGTTYTVSVTPVDCYGKKGTPINTSFTTAAAESVVYTSSNPVNFYGTFTNFDSATGLSRSSSNPAYDRTISGDVFAGAWNTKNTDTQCYVELATGKGYNGSKAIGVSSDNKDNHGLYIFATDSNGNSTDFSDMVYLRVWVDFTNVAFRKACFGLVSEHGGLYTTDEGDGRSDQYFWYLPEGSTTWTRYTHGTDGCFGDAQNSDVQGFKGWLAFPISDFVYRQNTGNVSAVDGRLAYHSNHICGVYLFWDYSDKTTCTGNKFYLDEIAIVEDYTVFDSYPS